MEIDTGRRWRVAEEMMGGFCDGMRHRIVDALENGQCSEREILMKAQALNVIRQFENQARSYIEQGKIAEREMRKYGEA